MELGEGVCVAKCAVREAAELGWGRPEGERLQLQATPGPDFYSNPALQD